MLPAWREGGRRERGEGRGKGEGREGRREGMRKDEVLFHEIYHPSMVPEDSSQTLKSSPTWTYNCIYVTSTCNTVQQ